MVLGVFAAVYGLLLFGALSGLHAGQGTVAAIPILGYLPTDAWERVWMEPVGPLILANALYAALGLLAWQRRSKTLTVYFVLLPLLGSLMFVLRFAAGMGSFR